MRVVTKPHFCVTLGHMSVAPRVPTPPQRVTAALLSDEVINSANAVRQAEVDLSQRRTERDDIIREASSVISMLKLARMTGLRRETIYRIVYSGNPRTETPTPRDV